jgi:OOP family OmpA-OmpF porin
MSRLHGRHTIAVAIAASILLVAPITACTGTDAPPPDESTCTHTAAVEGLAIAVGGRANSPKPVLPKSVTDVLVEQMDKKKGYTVVRVDGQPSIACAEQFSPQAVASEAKAAERRMFMETAFFEMRAARARQPEADPLLALSRAAAAAKPDGTVMLVDSGLQTVPPLDFRQQGLLLAQPDAVVQELKKRNLLPDLTNRKVVLAGIGYTAPPQKPLDDATRRRLVAIWDAIARAGGAKSVEHDTTPLNADVTRNVPNVSTVEIPKVDNINIGCDTESILSDEGEVGFNPDQTTFKDDAKAREALKKFADWLKARPSARVELIGTVAHHDRDPGNAGLPRARAETVADVLAALGVDRSRITARGDGWGPFPNKNAPPDPANDQLNRRVVVKLSC